MRTIWVFTALGLLLSTPLWAGDPAGGGPVKAVWKEQRLEFSYMGRTARYSCEGLRDKMRSLLLDLGARRDLQVSLFACDESAPLRAGYLGPKLGLVFSIPVMPDPGAKPAHPGDLQPVDARYEPFSLTSDAFKNFGVGDCELVEEFAREILPRFSARIAKQDITCIPFQATGSRFFVGGEILRARNR